jgi:hypothetical protein
MSSTRGYSVIGKQRQHVEEDEAEVEVEVKDERWNEEGAYELPRLYISEKKDRNNECSQLFGRIYNLLRHSGLQPNIQNNKNLKSTYTPRS